MFQSADFEAVQKANLQIQRAAAEEWLKNHKQVTDWQLDQARQAHTRMLAILETTFSTVQVSRDHTQAVMKSWMDVLLPTPKAQA